jgi:hypothetical protein
LLLRESPIGEQWERALSALGLPGGPWEFAPLAGDGSDRVFWRARQGPRRIVILLAPRKKAQGVDENDSYVRIGTHLRNQGLPVPRILWADAEAGLFLLEDLGDRHLQTHVAGLHSPAAVLACYRRVLRLLLQFHRSAPRGFNGDFCFDTPVYSRDFIYERELEYFRTAFLKGCLGRDVGAADLREDFQRLAECAGVCRTPLVMHRDFQSRNVMVHQGRLRLIDFQGARFGPPAYDCASLLLDPYVMLPYGLQEALVRFFWSGIEGIVGGSWRQFRRHYLALRICRNLQVLGAYGFLGRVKGKAGFLKYIPGALLQLSHVLHGPCRGWFPRLEEVVEEIESGPEGLRQHAPGGFPSTPQRLSTHLRYLGHRDGMDVGCGSPPQRQPCGRESPGASFA